MILIVDNEPEINFIVTEFFHKEGIEIVSTDSPEEALKLIREGNIKVLVTDIVMPKLNGIKLSKIVRKERPDIKIICMSGFLKKEIKGIEEVKADSFIEKPFMPEQLREKIKEVYPNN